MTNKSRVMFILRVSSRYLLSKRSGNSRLINVISFVGLVLGLSLLIVVLSVLNGTRDKIDDYIFEIFPHAIARVSPDQNLLLDELQSLPGVTSIEQFVDLRGLLNVQGSTPRAEPGLGIEVYGFEPDSSNRTFRQMYTVIKEPRDLPLAGMDFPVAIRYGLARGDTFTLTVPIVTARGVQFKTVAFRYARPMMLGDRGGRSRIMYVQIPDLIAHGIISHDQVHHRISLEDPYQADVILGEYPEVVTWTERFGSYYQALAMEKTILFVLLLFVIGLVIMSVISGQAMFINRKSSDIAILQTMGAELRWVSIVFMCQGAIIVVSGIIVGTILGCVVAHYAYDIMQFFERDRRNVTLYFDTANVSVQDLIWTISAVLLVGLVAILRPLNLVFKKDPVESLNRMV